MELQNQTEEDSIPVNESIISLLLKLHSQLSGRLDSFSPDEPAPAAHEPVGTGAPDTLVILVCHFMAEHWT